MATATPSRYAIAKPTSNSRANGILPVVAKGRPGNPATASIKGVAPRLKVVIRRLPPGLTEEEFLTFIGEEWGTDNEKIDWASYRGGKVSRK
jgi:regulator of nonsense transcripts 3